MRRRSSHLTGLLVAGSGVLVLSPDSLLVRLVRAGPAMLLVWRGLLMSLALIAFLAIRTRGRPLAALRGIGRPGLLAGLLFGASNVFFVLALERTTVATTLLILATGPLFAAIFSRVLLREPVGRRTVLAILAAIGGIGIAVSGGVAAGHLCGALLAAGAASSFAGQLAAIRFAADRDMTPSVALGGLLMALAALPFVGTFTVAAGDLGWLVLLGLVVMPLSFGLISLGPRWLTAPEVHLLMLLETVLGPIWVWLALAEPPSGREVAGGAVVILALSLHAAARLREPAGS